MTIEQLTNPVVRAAIKALNEGDRQSWLAQFIPSPELFDDGSPRDFARFTKDAIGHERFTSIDKTGDEGLEVFGHFHSDQWGDFKTYFKFKINTGGKISRLDIGQADQRDEPHSDSDV